MDLVAVVIGIIVFSLYLVVSAVAMLTLGFVSAINCRGRWICVGTLAVAGGILLFKAGPQTSALDLNCLVATAGLISLFAAAVGSALKLGGVPAYK